MWKRQAAFTARASKTALIERAAKTAPIERAVRTALIAFAAILLAPAAEAQIRIGQSAGFTGPVAAGVAETTAGAKLCFDAVNARGGVNGQKIELVSLDDRFDPAQAAKNAQTLAADPAVLALFLSRGTPQTEAMMPVLAKNRIALVAPSTGAMVLHRPVAPYVFNVRASYQREAQRAVEHLASIGVTRIALLHTNDSFGQDTTAGATQGFAAAKLTPAYAGEFDPQKPLLAPLVQGTIKADAQAVLFLGSSQAVADGTALLRAAGSRAQVVTLSNNASKGFIAQLGANAHGTIISQVFPNERSIASPLIQEMLKQAKAAHLPGVSPAMVEGYAGAKVVVEALGRAGARPTRASFIEALNSMGAYDLGGMPLSFSPTDHSGLDFVDLSIVDSEGRLQR